MWNLIRAAIIALAFVGFLGQTTARATPLPVVADAVEMSSDCAEMMVDQAGASDRDQMPCKDMTPECVVKMGCTAISPVLAPDSAVSRQFAGPGLSYSPITSRLDGMAPPPLRGPPKLQP